MVHENISVAIPYHGDRQKYVGRMINGIQKLPYIKEFVVTLEPESKFIINAKKLKVFKNENRLFVFRNKVEAVKRCESEWVALIDSDNIVNEIYFDVLNNLNPNVIYCPELGLPRLMYTHFVGKDISRETAPYMLSDDKFDCLFNTMNYVFHRRTWLKALESAVADPFEPMSCDSKWINYHCLKAGMVMRVISGMVYRHTIDDTSFYKNNAQYDIEEGPKIMNKIREWRNEDAPVKQLKEERWDATG